MNYSTPLSCWNGEKLPVLLLTALLIAGIAPKIRAADASWNTNSNGNWSADAVWSPTSAPGSTNSISSTDVATFGDVTTAVRSVTVDSDRNIFGILYSNNSYGYVVGGGVGSLLLSDGGYIRATGSGPAVTNTNNAKYIVIQGAAGSASFLNDSANATLAFLGEVAGAATAGNTSTLRLGGSNNTVTNVFNILLTDGTNGGKTALMVDGGIWNFTRNNSGVTNIYGTNYTGGLTVNAGYVTTAAQRNYGTGLTTIGATSGSDNATLNVSLGITNALLVRAGSSNNTLKLEITNTSGSASISSPLTLERDVELNVVNAAANANMTGAFAGTGTLTKTGSGTMTLNMTANRGNTITYAINGGTLNYVGPSSTSEKNRFEIGSGGLVTLTTTTMNIAGFDGSGVFDYLTTSARSMRIGGAGNYNFSGTISNTSASGLSMVMDLKEGGVQVFSGAKGNTGNNTARSGTFALDYASNSSSKLGDTNTLLLWYGNLDLRGGATTEDAGTLNLQYGQTTITRSSGSSVISFTNMSYNTGSHLNVGADNIVKTTAANVNGLWGGRAQYTVGGANFAKNDGSGNVVGLSSGDYTALNANTNGSSTVVYSLTDGLSGWTGATTLSTLGLKISTTQAGQVLDIGARPFLGTVLFVGADDYTMTSTGAISANSWFINYGSGNFTLSNALGGLAYFGGTGTTELAKASTAAAGVYVVGGTLKFSSNAQIGLESSAGNVTIAGGKLLADTTAGSISLTNSAGNRTVNLGGGDATIDVTGGNALTIGGVIGQIEGSGANPLTLGSATTSGKIVLGGANTFTGDVKLAGGTTSISSDSNLGNAANWVEFTGAGTLETTATFGTARYINLRSGKTGTFAPATGTTLSVTNYIQGAGALTVDGSGTLELLSAANSYTGKTTIKDGTLKLGFGASIAKSSEVNLGSTNSPGTLDLTANSSYMFGSSQTVSGNGTINIGSGKTVTVAGILAPGNSTGVTTVTGNLSLTSTSEIKMELAGTGGVAGTDFDQIDVSGYTMTAAGTLTITGYNGYNINQTASYDLFDFSTFSSNFDSVTVGGIGLSFDSGAWKGTSLDGFTSYDLGIADGVLAVTTIPEPSTYALLGLAGGALAAYRLRRRNR